MNRPLSFWPSRRNFSSPSAIASARRRVVGRLGFPRAPVPDDDVAGAVLLGRDHALEVEVLDRVVLDVDGHPALVRDRASGPWGRPTRPGRHRSRAGSRSGAAWRDGAGRRSGRARWRGDLRCGRRRLGRLPEVALAAVFVEGHGVECARSAGGANRRAARSGRGCQIPIQRVLGDRIDALGHPGARSTLSTRSWGEYRPATSPSTSPRVFGTPRRAGGARRRAQCVRDRGPAGPRTRPRPEGGAARGASLRGRAPEAASPQRPARPRSRGPRAAARCHRPLPAPRPRRRRRGSAARGGR